MSARTPKLLPLLAVAICGVLALKAVSGLSGAPGFLRQAKAYAETSAKVSHKGPAGHSGAAAQPATSSTLLPVGELAPAAADAATPASGTRAAPICAPSAADLAREAGLSPAELRVLQSLQSRRGELDDREQALQTQIALINAAETKVDGKLKTLNDLKAEIQGMLGQADQKQQSEVARLVIVYSAMKADQAAAIMAQLDDRVRIPVAAQMKERALALILAKMAPMEAKKITEKLASRFAPAEALTQKIASADGNTTPATAAAATPRPRPIHRARKPVVKVAAKPGDMKAQTKPIAPAAVAPASPAQPTKSS